MTSSLSPVFARKALYNSGAGPSRRSGRDESSRREGPRHRRSDDYLLQTTEDARDQEIQEALQELCLAHEVVLVTACGAGRRGLPEGTRPPVLIDDGAVYQGRNAIHAHLEKLKALRELWYKYGSDACYCGEEGNVE